MEKMKKRHMKDGQMMEGHCDTGEKGKGYLLEGTIIKG
jgi:hypothetical protein